MRDRLSIQSCIVENEGELCSSMRKLEGTCGPAIALAIVYDISNPESFESVPKWQEELVQYLGLRKKAILFLIGNKQDKERAVPKQEAEALAKKFGLTFFETCATEDTDVDETFSRLVARYIEQIDSPIKWNIDYDYLFKFVTIGESGVGKTSLVLRYTHDTFNENQQSTIGVDFCRKMVKVDTSSVKLQVWDTAGQERYRGVVSSYFRASHGVILVYDVTKPETLEALDNWFGEVNKYCSSHVKKLVIGTKADLVEERAVTEEEGRTFAEKIDAIFFETSAKDSTGVNEAFMALTITVKQGIDD